MAIKYLDRVEAALNMAGYVLGSAAPVVGAGVAKNKMNES